MLISHRHMNPRRSPDPKDPSHIQACPRTIIQDDRLKILQGIDAAGGLVTRDVIPCARAGADFQ